MKTFKCFLFIVFFGAGTVFSEDKPSDSDRITALELKVASLTSELEKDVFGDVIPELGDSVYGMGPAASKVYSVDHGLSLGGYGEGLYQNYEGDKTDTADFLRAILYVGYKFNDKWVLNTEFEFEHADESFVEFAYLDYLHDPALNFRVGLVLIPVGLINELHEPTVFLSAVRPTVETTIIPTTWRENGGGIFGDAGIVSYKAYVVNSLDAEDFDASGIRNGRQKGSKAKAEDWSFVGRVDVTPNNALMFGSSVYYGDQGQDIDVDASMTMIEGHVVMNWGGLTIRGLAVVVNIDNTAELTRMLASADLTDGEMLPPDSDLEAVGEELFGWYVEAGYDVLAHRNEGEESLTPYIRYEEANTQQKVASGFTKDESYNKEIITVGLNFKPIDEIVFKVEHQFIENGNNESADQTNVAMGYVF